MRKSGYTVRTFGMLLLIGAGLMLGLGAVGCQTLVTTPVGRMVDQDFWIPLQAGGRQASAWNGMYVTVRYDYARNGDSLNLRGEVRYASRIADNYTSVQYFHMDVMFLDPQGKVLDSQPIATDSFDILFPRGADPTVPFDKEMILPVNTAAMAFSYRGQAISTGDGTGAPRYFWEYPVH